MVKTLGIEQFAPMNHIYRFYELNDYMKSIAEIGYHSMDLWTCGSHYFVDSNNYEDTKYIKKLMSQYDIRIVSITPRQSCPNIASSPSTLGPTTPGFAQKSPASIFF